VLPEPHAGNMRNDSGTDAIPLLVWCDVSFGTDLHDGKN
jgi:hypothetical protein